MSSGFENLVVCISFGHDSDQVGAALEGAIEYAKSHPKTAVVVVDDCSGVPPRGVDGAILLETVERCGFSGAVNHVLDTYPGANGRLLLINPDASVSVDAVAGLLAVQGDVAVPLVLNPSGNIENIRRATTAFEQMLSLVLGENMAGRICQTPTTESLTVRCPPHAPSGSVVAYPIEYLRETPLRPEYFWLEQSDWIYRRSRMHGDMEVSIVPVEVSHTGASTSLRYPVSVAASQLRTKINFISEYGGMFTRLLMPLGVVLRSIRFGIKTRRLSNAWFLIKVALGSADWRVDK